MAEAKTMTLRKLHEILEARSAAGEEQLDAGGYTGLRRRPHERRDGFRQGEGRAPHRARESSGDTNGRSHGHPRVVFVRGKIPTEDIVDMARENGMVLLSTKYSMFLACGRLYEAGLRSGESGTSSRVYGNDTSRQSGALRVCRNVPCG